VPCWQPATCCLTSVYGADEPALRKPAPAMLQRAANALGLSAHELLMVGDSGADLRAASAAGSPAAWAGWGYVDAHALPIEPQWRVEHPAQVLGILQSACR
jgi:phosphoglycolate phosphatase